MCGLTPAEFERMTPAEFTVLLDSRIKYERLNMDFYDTLNAFNCQVTLGNKDLKISDFKIITEDVIDEPKLMSDDDVVDVMRQWVTATGGKTI